MLNGRGLGRVEERRGRGGAEEGQEAGDFFSSPPPPSSFIYQPVIPSPGVPFDSLQPCKRLPIQDGGHNSRTKDYSALARHKIRLHCKLLHERCMRFFFKIVPLKNLSIAVSMVAWSYPLLFAVSLTEQIAVLNHCFCLQLKLFFTDSRNKTGNVKLVLLIFAAGFTLNLNWSNRLVGE